MLECFAFDLFHTSAWGSRALLSFQLLPTDYSPYRTVICADLRARKHQRPAPLFMAILIKHYQSIVNFTNQSRINELKYDTFSAYFDVLCCIVHLVL